MFPFAPGGLGSTTCAKNSAVIMLVIECDLSSSPEYAATAVIMTATTVLMRLEANGRDIFRLYSTWMWDREEVQIQIRTNAEMRR